MAKEEPRSCAFPDGEAKLSRRGFLGALTAGLSALIGVVLGGSGLGYFISPAFKKEDESWVDLGPVADIHPGSPVKIDYVQRRRDAWVVNERRSSAWVATDDGKNFTVFDPRCTHLGCPFRWDDVRKEFLCPCHAAVFAADGKVVSGPPPRPLDRYGAKVEGGRLLIQPDPGREAS